MTNETLHIDSPKPFQVLQRRVPRFPVSADAVCARGSGPVTVHGRCDAPATRAEIRTVSLVDAFGEQTDWTEAELDADGKSITASADIAAGGWFRLEARLLDAERVVASGDVSPVGVGEVFIVAGQSYMAACSESITVVEDPSGRATATSPEAGTWRVAHDPQPGIVTRLDAGTLALLAEWARTLDMRFPHGESSPFRGSVWPQTLNHLVPLLRVPVGLVHVTVGGTTVRQWQPPGVLYQNLRDGVRLAGDYRAVLWGLGESDAVAGTSTEQYVRGVTHLRDTLTADTGMDRPWIAAKTTIHPAYQQDEAKEAAIRSAVDELWHRPGFERGPDTDILDGLGVHRADDDHGGHFTALGQQRAALLWFAAIWHALVDPSVCLPS